MNKYNFCWTGLSTKTNDISHTDIPDGTAGHSVGPPPSWHKRRTDGQIEII